MKQIGIYVHIPFCQKKCNYCDFVSYSNKEEFIKDYVDSVCTEIKEVGQEVKQNIQDKRIDDLEVKTIYIGGGTPSYIGSKYIEEIVRKIKENFTIVKNAEITIEINPGTITNEKALCYKNIGINRVSLGLQSANSELLKMLGRIHNLEQFEEAYNLIKNAGFENINIDFMIGLPNQTMQDIEDMLKYIENLKPNHISVYSLILEENTQIEKQISSGKLELPKDELEREMYWKVRNELEKLGYKHYEISNFALNGYESKHNMDCWEQKEYMGFGVAAHSYMDRARFSNIESVEEYIENMKNGKSENNFVFHEKQDKVAQMKEYMILGLRKIDGIDCSIFEARFDKDVFDVFEEEIEKLLSEDLIVLEDGRIKLSNKGIDLANLVWEEFI